MTDPDDKPSFLARFSVVATNGVCVFQFVLFVGGLMEKWFINSAYSPSGRKYSDGEATATRPEGFEGMALLYVCLLIALSYLVVAGLYYLIKGKPTNADAVIASRLYRVWGASVIIGAIYSFLI